MADPFSAITCEILLVRLDLPNSDFEALGGRAGFIRWDLRETLNDLPINTTSERRFAIPGLGEYASLAILMIKGANPNRYGDLSAVVTAGAETQFRLEAAGNALKTWRMKHRYLLNSENSAMLPMAMIAPVSEAVPISTAGASNGVAWVTAKNAAGAGNFGGPLETGLNIQNPAVVGFDFVGDNHGSVSELGGCLNANFPSDAIKWEIVGNILTPATYQSSFNLIGRRYRDNIEAYKRIKAA